MLSNTPGSVYDEHLNFSTSPVLSFSNRISRLAEHPSITIPGALESGFHVVAVGEGVAGEQLQVPQVRRVRRPPEARVVRAVLWIIWEVF